MDLKIVCGTWVNEDDEKILNVLQSSDKRLSVEELSERTGLSPHSVERTLGLLKHQESIYESRKKLAHGE